MHSPSVIRKYGHRRFFLACDGLTDPQSLFTAIARLFGVEDGRKIGFLKKFITSIEEPVMLTLDNFESPWEPSENRGNVEALLGQLTEVPNLTLIATLRGAERPLVVP